MATKKKLLQAAAGTAAAGGAGLDITEVFSTFLYTGSGASRAIENGINLGQSFGSGSVEFDRSNSGYLSISSTSTLALASDYTVEMFLYNVGAVNSYLRIFNNAPGNTPSGFFYVYTKGTNIHMYNADAGSLTNVGTFSAGVWFHLAISRSGSTTRVFVNGTQSHSYTGTTNFTNNGWFIGGGPDTEFNDINISNFRVVTGTALYTSNFTPPTSELTAVTNTALLTCQGSDFFADNSSNSLTITKNGGPTFATFGPFDAADAGEGGMTWIKSRTSANTAYIYDTERGATTSVTPSDAYAQESSGTTLTAFNSNGFSLGSANKVNGSSNNYASWTWRKAPKFFTCLTYSGTGTAQNISHDLGSDVGFLLIKRTDGSGNWRCWHRGLPGTGSNMEFNQTGAYETATTIFNGTDPTSTQFSVGTNSNVNASGGTYVAYLFAHNDSGDGGFGPDGDQDIIKCGTYTEAGSGAQEINLGFEPQWLMVKPFSGTGDWWMYDTMRGQSYGGSNRLKANVSDAEAAQAGYFAPTPNGFIARLSGSAFFGSGVEVIYMAVRRGPLALPEAGTEVFKPVLATSTDAYSVGFETDFALFNKLAGLSFNTIATTRLQGGGKRLSTATTAAETSSNVVEFDLQDSFKQNILGSSSLIRYHWKRAPGYFDAVAYSGTGVNRTVSHNVLNVAPEMMWIKGRNYVENWAVYHKDVGATKYLMLNQTSAEATYTAAWNNTAPTSSVFTLGGWNAVNESGYNYIAYLFASLDGVSKVGSYTGTGQAGGNINVDCGFTSGARFVMIKRTDASGSWWVADTARGIVSGNEPLLALNDTSAEVTGFNMVEPYSSGFTVNGSGVGSDNSWNDAGGSYIFYAIA